jgi:hypothetical protein
MRIRLFAFACCAAVAGASAGVAQNPDDELAEVEASIVEGLGAQGQVVWVDIERSGAHRLQGRAIIRPRETPTAELPFAGTAVRDSANQSFTWQCDSPRAHPDLVGRWTDNHDCDQVTVLRQDGRFVAPNGNEGNWGMLGSQLTLWGPGGSVSWLTSLPSGNVLVLTDADGATSRSTRC